MPPFYVTSLVDTEVQKKEYLKGCMVIMKPLISQLSEIVYEIGGDHAVMKSALSMWRATSVSRKLACTIH